LAILHLVYTRARPVPWISALTGGVTVATWGGVTVGIIALAAVRAHAPLADIWLARADAMVGADTHVPNRTLVHRLWMVEDGP
jgi:hypothetical protein